MFFEVFDSVQGLVERPATAPRLPRAIMNEIRPIDADADRDIVLLNEFAPAIVNEGAVGLEMIHQLEVPENVADSREILCILLPAYDRGLARVPDDTETRFKKLFILELLDSSPDDLNIHDPPVFAVRQIAVRAVKIAERGW